MNCVCEDSQYHTEKCKNLAAKEDNGLCRVCIAHKNADMEKEYEENEWYFS